MTMTLYAKLIVFGPLIAALGYAVATFVLTVARQVRDSRQGWTCACGERFQSRTAGPAPFHRLHH